MKYFIVCASLVLGLVNCIEGKPLNKQQKELLATYKKECIGQSGVSPEVVEKSKEGIFANDPLLKEFQLCFSQKIGFQNSDGKINQDVFAEKLKKFARGDETLFEKLKKCGVESTSPQETAFQVSQCLYNACPLRVQYYLFPPGIVNLAPEKAEKVFAHYKDCVNETQVDEELVKNAHKRGDYKEDPRLKEFCFCLSKKIGFQNENGDLQKDVFRVSAKEIISDEALLNKLSEKCLVQKDNPQETAFSVFKCVSETSPVRINFFPTKGFTFRRTVRKCIKESRVDVSFIRLAKQGNFTDDQKLKDYYFCIAKSIGVVGEDGEIKEEVVKEKTCDLFKDPAVAEEVFMKCFVKRDSPMETVFQSVQCYTKNLPGHVDIFQTALPEEFKQKIDANLQYCSGKYPVEKEILEKSRIGDFVDDKALKEYLFCINRKLRIQFEDGKLDVETFKKHLRHFMSRRETHEVVERCATTQDVPENTAFELSKCFYAYAPEFETVF